MIHANPENPRAGGRPFPKYDGKEPVALFIPCYIDQFYPQIGEATARLLTRSACRWSIRTKQTCCGQPAFNSGYWEEARTVIHHFCDVFEPHRWIVSPSGSCTAMCRVFFGHADPDPQGRRASAAACSS